MKTDNTNASLSPLGAVLEIQRTIDDTIASIQTMQAAIRKTKDSIGKQQADLIDLEPLLRQREDLLADVAIGTKKASAVDKLNAEIEQLSKQNEAAKPALDSVSQAVAGLQRRLAASLAELENLKDRKKVLLGEFFKSHAQALGVEYAQAAKNIAALYEQLHGLAEIMEAFDSRLKIQPWNIQHLCVPNFLLPSLTAPDEKWPVVLYHKELHGWFKPKNWMNEQLELLAESGIRMKEEAQPLPAQSRADAVVSDPFGSATSEAFKGQRLENPKLASQR